MLGGREQHDHLRFQRVKAPTSPNWKASFTAYASWWGVTWSAAAGARYGQQVSHAGARG